MTPTRILIADHHEIVRQGLRHTLHTKPGWEVVAEAANWRQAVRFAEALQPDVAVLDLGMPDMNGLEAIRRIVEIAPKMPVLALSIHDADVLRRAALGAGARGYLLKSDAARDLISAVQSLLEGRPFFTANVSEALLETLLDSSTPRRPDERPRLTPREQEIVRLVTGSRTNKQIAALLRISVRTVETHRSNIMEKLGIHSTSDLILYATRHGLKEISMPDPAATAS